MRTACSIVFTFVGLALLYLFASGALVTPSGDWSLDSAVTRAFDPFANAGTLALIGLSVAVACFATGAAIAPRTSIVVHPRSPAQRGPNGPVERRTDLSVERLLETALVINVLVVGATLVLLSLAVADSTWLSSSTLGALFAIAAVETVIGSALLAVLFRLKRSWSRRLRPIFACSAGLNITEGLLLGGVLLLGFI